MSLVHLVPEIFNQINNLISASDLTRLYFSGDKWLISLLTAPRAVTKFYRFVSHPCGVGWPRSVCYFPHLREFSLVHDQSVDHIPLKGADVVQLPPSLTKLELMFVNAFSSLQACFSREACSQSSSFRMEKLSERWQNLETLILPRKKENIPLGLAGAPSSLKVLRGPVYLPISLLGTLSRTITDLTLLVAPEVPFSGVHEYPPDLLRLVAYFLPSEHSYAHIPRTVTDLEVTLSHSCPSEAMKDFGASLLPPHLLRFDLKTSISHYPLCVAFAQGLPRELTELHWSLSNTPRAEYT
jgi:hypothetical protein